MAHLMGSVLNKPPGRSLFLSKRRKNNLSQVKQAELKINYDFDKMMYFYKTVLSVHEDTMICPPGI